ncbi:MAG: alpha-E domain-containing protein [Bryobacterales bacterium]|nr:alpha-E domain-containing protein [Bryobacterales bacterium]
MLSRVAESIYWMNRYIERAENVARFLEVNENLMLDLPPGLLPQWGPLIEITGDAEAFKKAYGDADQEEVCWFLSFDSNNPNSIISSLRAARENARSIREILSAAVWAEINEAYLLVERLAKSGSELSYDFRRHVVRASHSVEGATNATLSHAEPWHFSRIGRLLERADKTTRIVDIRYFVLLPSPADVGSPTDDLHWTAVLQSVSALEMYRQRHGMVRLDQTAGFLILDPEFPRSVRNCLRRADQSLHAITGTPAGTFRNLAEHRLGRLVSRLDYTAVDEVIIAGLHEFLDDLQVGLNGIGDAMQSSFFAPRIAPGGGADGRALR